MSDFAPADAAQSGTAGGFPPGAFPSPLDAIFPPEKERLDAPSRPPKHEFEIENRRNTDWPRRRAIVVDSLLLGGIFYLLDGALGGYLGAAMFTTALALTYFFVTEATTGQTLGKRLMKLRVVMRDGRPAPANAIAARTVLRLIDVLPFAWIFGGLTMLLTGGRRQRLGDLAARTVVRRDDRSMPRPPHSPLLGLYPILWIGMALALMWQVNLFDRHVQIEGHVTSNPYMRKVNDICQRRVDREAALGATKTSEQTGALWAGQLGAIDSLPKPPANARHAMRVVKREIHEFLLSVGRLRSKAAESSDTRRLAIMGAAVTRRLQSMQKRFRKLGLPACGVGKYWVN